LSNNIIKDVARLCPLKRIKDLTVCLVGNSFYKTDGWKSLIESFKFSIDKQPRDFSIDKQKDKEKVESANEQLASATNNNNDNPIGLRTMMSGSDSLAQDTELSPRSQLASSGINNNRRIAIRRYRQVLDDSLNF
jgi:hypothetical protein